MINRRQALVGILTTSGLSLASSNTWAAQVQKFFHKAPKNLGGGNYKIPGIPVGEVIEITTPLGDTIEVAIWPDPDKDTSFPPAIVNDNDIILNFAARPLLSGVYEIEKPGENLINRTPTSRVGYPPNTFAFPKFSALVDSFVAPGIMAARMLYRHPVHYPGTHLQATDGRLILRVDSPGLVPALIVALVDFDVAPETTRGLSLLPYPPFAAIRTYITTWTIEPGSGRRDYEIGSVEVPWGSRCLGVVRLTPVTQTVDVRVMAEKETEELGISPTPADPPGPSEPTLIPPPATANECGNPALSPWTIIWGNNQGTYTEWKTVCATDEGDAKGKAPVASSFADWRCVRPGREGEHPGDGGLGGERC